MQWLWSPVVLELVKSWSFVSLAFFCFASKPKAETQHAINQRCHTLLQSFRGALHRLSEQVNAYQTQYPFPRHSPLALRHIPQLKNRYPLLVFVQNVPVSTEIARRKTNATAKNDHVLCLLPLVAACLASHSRTLDTQSSTLWPFWYDFPAASAVGIWCVTTRAAAARAVAARGRTIVASCFAQKMTKL